MNNNPKVSVVIPSYNYAHFIDDAIQSVLDQTFTDFELVIVDNCSTDNTEEVVKKYLTDGRVSFHRNEANLGLAGNWNRCLEHAKGAYIKFLCADDKFKPQLLEKFVAVMDQHPGVSLVTSNSEVFGGKSRIRVAPFTGLVSGELARKTTIVDIGKNWFSGPTGVMFRNADVKKVGKFNPQLLALMDLELWLRLLTVGDCYVVPDVLACFRVHGATQTILAWKKKHDRTFDSYWFMMSVKKASPPQLTSLHLKMDEFIKKRASSCAAVMYKVLPKLYKKENRKLFKTAFQIGYAEGVLFDPIVRLFQGRVKMKKSKSKIA